MCLCKQFQYGSEMRMKENIAFIIERYAEFGGTERVTSHIMNALSERKYSIKLLEVFKTHKSPFPLDINIKQDYLLNEKYHTICPDTFKEKLKIFTLIVYNLIKFFKKERISVVVLSSTHHACYAILAAKICNVKVISWEHFNCRSIVDYKPLAIGRFLSARFADYVITLTEQDKDLWYRDFKVKSKIVSIPNIVTDYKNISYENRQNIILTCGRVTHQKGYDLLLQVWEKITADPRSEGWELHIYGKIDECDFSKKILSYIKEKSIKKIYILPAKNKIEYEYKKASIYVAPSRYEGFSVALAESASAGIPAVSFDCLCGGRDIISSGESGYLVNVQDIDGMAKKVLTLMKDEESRKIMGQKAKERSKRYYEDKVILSWEKIISDILK